MLGLGRNLAGAGGYQRGSVLSRCAYLGVILFVYAVCFRMSPHKDRQNSAPEFEESSRLGSSIVLLRRLLETNTSVTDNNLDGGNRSFDISNTSSSKLPHCTPPAYHEFPPDAFTNQQRKHGAVAIHILVVLYMFLALAIVCDDYFVSSLEKICEQLGFSEDVAGATFMAAGSSAPELFTSIIGVFVAKGDVGTGTIVGSAVFNILFVIGICGLCAGQNVKLTWWPLFRDSAFYSVSVIVLIVVIYDGVVTWAESVAMLAIYAMYILIMKFNTSISRYIMKRRGQAVDDDTPTPAPTQNTLLQTAPFANEPDLSPQPVSSGANNIPMLKIDGLMSPVTEKPESMAENAEPNGQAATVPIDEHIRDSPRRLSFHDAGFRVMLSNQFDPKTRMRTACRVVIMEKQLLRNQSRVRRLSMKSNRCFQQLSFESELGSYTKAVYGNITTPEAEVQAFDSWKKVPKADGAVEMVKWAVCWPLRAILFITVPDCRKRRWEKWFIATFMLSIFWIAIFSYVMVWMVMLIGFTLGVPDSIMGITFLAAGTSIPDAIASLIVARNGLGDMAVSNSIGSNVFDILIGLATPWFMQTALISPGSLVHINSRGLIYSVMLLFLTVAFTILTIHLNRWELSKKVGVIFMLVYAVFLTFSVMIEFNMFGFVNPPMCIE
ncbi:PREDICTED: sodium/potassium/calcium exchanger 4-like [Priapulus caudatus]|uniref:Sodium/potassium/calcium exchanger 4-like n=1 Tax=Priapulus caudatus TaxID=37621 RepID=A0ABM1E4H9_PRICU|nr:PREDICTED: sodium/potassium/calcium exchanger 4-like [Priapulus caudatus]